MTSSPTTYCEYIAWTNRVIDYISINLDKHLSVSELASVACSGLSPTYPPSYTLHLNADEMKEGKPAEISICVMVEPLHHL
jgi:hypothetical protein